jgi:hypothetical protein
VWGFSGNTATNGLVTFSPSVSDAPISTVISNLVPGIRYYWYLTATNQLGVASTFDTPFVSAPPFPPGDTDGNGVVDQSEFNAAFSNYLFNSEALLMTNVSGLGSNQVTFQLSNLPPIMVQSSTDLESWSVVGPAMMRYHFGDTNAPGAPQIYYRLRFP